MDFHLSVTAVSISQDLIRHWYKSWHFNLLLFFKKYACTVQWGGKKIGLGCPPISTEGSPIRWFFSRDGGEGKEGVKVLICPISIWLCACIWRATQIWHLGSFYHLPSIYDISQHYIIYSLCHQGCNLKPFLWSPTLFFKFL